MAPALYERIMKQAEFTALVDRLEKASTVLYAGGSLLQAIARRYYLVTPTLSRRPRSTMSLFVEERMSTKSADRPIKLSQTSS
jgi:hypothetical protein